MSELIECRGDSRKAPDEVGACISGMFVFPPLLGKSWEARVTSPTPATYLGSWNITLSLRHTLTRGVKANELQAASCE